jgi:hypothetical protein
LYLFFWADASGVRQKLEIFSARMRLTFNRSCQKQNTQRKKFGKPLIPHSPTIAVGLFIKGNNCEATDFSFFFFRLKKPKKTIEQFTNDKIGCFNIDKQLYTALI